METIVIAVIIFILVLSARLGEGKAPKPYTDRLCRGKEWKKAFPGVPKEKIRMFLTCFVDGMAFGGKERLKFGPSDEILKVYQAIYGGKTPLSDAMELETFYGNLIEDFNVTAESLNKVWHVQLTLGELFSCILAQQDDSVC